MRQLLDRFDFRIGPTTVAFVKSTNDDHLLCAHTMRFSSFRRTTVGPTTGLKSQVVSSRFTPQTAHSWAGTGVLLGARVRRRVAFGTINYRDAVSERGKVIVN